MTTGTPFRYVPPRRVPHHDLPHRHAVFAAPSPDASSVQGAQSLTRTTLGPRIPTCAGLWRGVRLHPMRSIELFSWQLDQAIPLLRLSARARRAGDVHWATPVYNTSVAHQRTRSPKPVPRLSRPGHCGERQGLWGRLGPPRTGTDCDAAAYPFGRNYLNFAWARVRGPSLCTSSCRHSHSGYYYSPGSLRLGGSLGVDNFKLTEAPRVVVLRVRLPRDVTDPKSDSAGSTRKY
jgi:hypothetical protein